MEQIFTVSKEQYLFILSERGLNYKVFHRKTDSGQYQIKTSNAVLLPLIKQYLDQ